MTQQPAPTADLRNRRSVGVLAVTVQSDAGSRGGVLRNWKGARK